MKPYIAFKLLLIAFLLLCAATTEADRIILKDGTIEDSERVWQSGQYVHFILKGTKTIEIRYAKEIVDRIESSSTGQTLIIESPSAKDQTADNPAQDMIKKPVATVENDASEGLRPAITDNKNIINRDLVAENKGIPFYDPRRRQIYWSSSASKHKSITAAMDMLAQMYGKPKEWIEKNMGEENDLGEIHKSLIMALDKEGTVNETASSEQILPKSAPASNETEAVPDLPNGKSAQSLAKQDVTNTDTHDREKPGGMEKSVKNEKSHAMPIAAPGKIKGINLPVIPKGIPFYNPRRAEKYWIDPTHRFNTLQDALKALADLYGVSEDWIGDHLGQTNDLSEIHQNIRNNLK